MRDIGILFQGAMVRAILADLKTQTRRVMKPQPDSSLWTPEGILKEKEWRPMPCLGPGHHVEDNIWGLFNKGDEYNAIPYVGVKCPYGKAGDRLWVRETFRGGNDTLESVFYRADDSLPSTPIYQNLGVKWKPSIFMPRAFSRITLEVVSMRVERVQEITFKDSISEGYPDLDKYSRFTLEDKPRRWFETLWDSINAAPKLKKHNPYTLEKEVCYVSYPWDNIRAVEMHKGLVHYIVGNPWVWIPEFKRVER